MKNIYTQVEQNMNELVGKQVWWSACATPKQMQNARNDKLELKLGINRCVPTEWI